MALTEEQKGSIKQTIAEALGDSYDCTRVWSAWGVGTMSQDDFVPVSAQDDRLEEIADAVIASLPKPKPVGYQFQDREGNWKPFIDEQHQRLTIESGAWNVRAIYAEAPIAQPASAPSEQKPVELPFAIFDQEIADLRRFHECAMDDEGYDVPKDRMKRLAEIGLVRRASGNYYEHTDFGLSVLNGDFDTAPQHDYKAQRDAERYRWLREALSDRSMHGKSHHFCSISRGHPEELDEAIDAAIASVKGGA